MGGDRPDVSSRVASSRNDDRLESWKEIAAYLKRDVRTVQRWEKREGLPVSRHVHEKLSSVYAHKSEIDAWWASRRLRLEAQDDSSAPVLTADEEAEYATATGLERIEPGSAVSLTPATTARAASRRQFVAGIALGAAVLAIPLLWLVRNLLRPALPAGPTLVNIADLNWTAARVSRDGKRLAFVDAASNHLSVRDLQNGAVESYVNEHVQPVFAWSQDSAALAFLTMPDVADPAVMQLETIEIASRQRRVLWQGVRAALVEPFDWTPDGKHILCRIARSNGEYQVATLALDNRRITPLINLPSRPAGLRLSPDGSLAAYSIEREHNWDIFVQEFRPGGRQVRLTDHPGRDLWPFWTPEGKHIVFLRRRGASTRLMIQAVDPRTGTPTGDEQVVAGPGNRSLPLSITQNGELFFARRKRASQVFLLDLDDPAAKPSSSFEDDTLDPVWSADGRSLYYRKVLQSGEVLLANRNISSSNEIVLRLPHSYEPEFFVPTDDPASVVFFGTLHGTPKRFYLYRQGAEDAEPLWPAGGDILPPAQWSSRQHSLLCAGEPDREGRFPIQIFARKDSQPRTVAFSRTRPFPQSSPDETVIAYTDRNCLLAIPAAGGEARQITCGPAGVLPRIAYLHPGGLSWASDGKRIAWSFHNAAERRVEIWIVNVRTGEHSVAYAGERDYASWPSLPAWAPGANRLAFRMDYRPEYELWRLTGFLR